MKNTTITLIIITATLIIKESIKVIQMVAIVVVDIDNRITIDQNKEITAIIIVERERGSKITNSQDIITIPLKQQISTLSINQQDKTIFFSISQEDKATR